MNFLPPSSPFPAVLFLHFYLLLISAWSVSFPLDQGARVSCVLSLRCKTLGGLGGNGLDPCLQEVRTSHPATPLEEQELDIRECGTDLVFFSDGSGWPVNWRI